MEMLTGTWYPNGQNRWAVTKDDAQFISPKIDN